MDVYINLICSLAGLIKIMYYSVIDLSSEPPPLPSFDFDPSDIDVGIISQDNTMTMNDSDTDVHTSGILPS